VNAYSIVYVNLPTGENIYRTNDVCIVPNFLGLSFRSSAKALDSFIEERSHVAVWNWVKLASLNRFYLKRTRVTAFIIDETMLQISSDYESLWVAIVPAHKKVLEVYIPRHRNTLVAESFLRTLIKSYGKYTTYSAGGS
jgi:putative transposase